MCCLAAGELFVWSGCGPVWVLRYRIIMTIIIIIIIITIITISTISSSSTTTTTTTTTVIIIMWSFGQAAALSG